MSKKEEAKREEACKELRKLLKPGAKVYTILKHRSSNGMSRVIDLVIPYRIIEPVWPKLPDGRTDYEAKPTRKFVGLGIRSIGWIASKAMDDKWDLGRGGIKIGGCGMDMGFALVYNLGSALWPKGTRKPHGIRNGEPDSDGGYALNHEWL